ncbi:MAG: hypothetical protein OHK0039_49190 [Bacteroidia bacterium]
MTFWILWGFVALIVLVIVYFFLVGIADGSVSTVNLGLWLILLGVAGGVLMGGLWLRMNDHPKAALALLGVLAIPGLIVVLFLLLVMLGKPRWN